MLLAEIEMLIVCLVASFATGWYAAMAVLMRRVWLLKARGIFIPDEVIAPLLKVKGRGQDEVKNAVDASVDLYLNSLHSYLLLGESKGNKRTVLYHHKKRGQGPGHG